jgi:GNAT superfamily N-acetyltransferase
MPHSAVQPLPEITTLRDGAALAQYEIDPGLGAFWGYPARRAQVVREALGRTLCTPGAEVLIAARGASVVGYLLIAPPTIDQPWGRLRDPRVLEVSVEVARGERGKGIATALFSRVFGRPPAESRIYVAAGYVWCWDVERGSAASAYADRLLRFFERYGFRREWTSEPNVALEPVNFLAVRIGRLVPPPLLRRFRQAERGEAA